MTERVALKADPRFVSSGSFLLDLVLGGGWARGRVVNVVGDRSAGKTLLAIEACANFARASNPANSRYAEIESAFDDDYAADLGMPPGVKRSQSGEIETVEQFHNDLVTHLQAMTGPGIYVVDSLDALSDAAEMTRGFDEGTYGASKAKQMSQLFRRQIAEIDRRGCTLFVVSQVRDKIGVVFGETKTRSGGRALDFYASQILWLSEIGKIKRQTVGVERVVGVRVLARTKKNKVGTPFREAELAILFGYGIDDEFSMLDWLKKNKAEELLPLPAASLRGQLSKAREARDRDKVAEIAQTLQAAVQTRWREIEAALEPPMRKYE
jgi:recombination protein RecA